MCQYQKISNLHLYSFLIDKNMENDFSDPVRFHPLMLDSNIFFESTTEHDSLSFPSGIFTISGHISKALSEL
jgi:hypothetical protein